MGRRRYILAYDIRDAARLRRVHDIAKGYGFGLQYSVFVCDLDAVEKISLRTDLGQVLHLAEDSVVLVDLGDPADRGTSCFEFIGTHVRLPSGGPTIT